MLKICGISDMHGILDFNIEKCDVLCICGDIVPLDIQNYHKPTFKWLKNVFIPWCQNQPCEKVLLVGGNHDIKIADHEQELRSLLVDTKITYLLDEECTIIDNEGNEFKFYGSPWCHIFGNWAFMISDESIAEKLSNMPNDVDVLLTHDAPYGTSDILLQDVYWATKQHIGSKPLRDAVIDKQPRLMLKGHLHSCNQDCEMLNKTNVYTVSVVDERYKRVYEPHYFELTKDSVLSV